MFSACLTSSCGLCRYLPMSIASSFRFHPLRCHLSTCLLCRLGCVDDSVLISSCGMYCDVLLAHRLVSSLVSFVVSSVGSVSVSSLAPFLDTMGGETSDCGWLSFFVLISCRLPRSPVLACLGAFLAIHLMRMAAEVCGLSSRRAVCLLAPLYPCRAALFVSPLGRSISWLVRLVRLCAVPRCCGFGFGGGCHAPAVHHPILPGCLLRAD